MTEFFDAVGRHAFLQYALWAGLLSSVSCGVVGTYVVVRRVAFLAGGVAHSVLGGIGVAQYLKTVHVWPIEPMHGAIVAAVLSALVIGVAGLRARQNEDIVVGALWAIGMAVGLLFLSRTPGYRADLMGYLFGDILMVSRSDLWLIGGLNLVVLVVVGLFYKQLLAVCFNEEFARLQDVPVTTLYLVLLCLAALTVVVLIQVVGLILVIALLTLPAAIARLWSGSVRQTMAWATLLGMIFTTLGLAVSYQPDLPAGATIILIAGGTYLFCTAGSLAIKRLRRAR